MEVITTYRSPLDTLRQWVMQQPDRIYLHQPIDGAWRTWTWAQTEDEASRMAGALHAMGLPSGSRIGVVSKNCAHWILSDLAIMMAGHVSVPLYPNLTAASVNHILLHSGAVALFVGKLDDWPSMQVGVPDGIRCIAFPYIAHAGCEKWDTLIAKQAPMSEPADRGPDEIGTILYTSGTTGVPKGVVHRFRTFSFTTQNATPYLGFSTASRFFSYLPLSHSAERSLVEMGSLYCGGTVYFAESIPRFATNLSEACPSEFLAVHHIWKKFQQRILESLPQRRIDLLLRLPVVSKWLCNKVQRGLGLRGANNVITGASPTPVALIEWFAKLGVRIQEGYGMTENWSYSHINHREHIRPGTVGLPFPGVEARIGDEGEVLVRHPGLMLGYYKDPVKTMEAFTADGFLRTGDVGSIDAEGYLTITGRVKDLFKTSKGNYVAPAPIEMRLCGNDLIEMACVLGNDLHQPMALVLLSDQGRGRQQADLRSILSILHAEINATLDSYEKLSRIIVIKDTWSIENGMLTPTLKIKRNEVESRYGPQTPQWSAQHGPVAFQAP